MNTASRVRANVRRMQGYTPGEQPLDREVIKLNTNENPYPPSPRVAAALAGLDAGRLRLYPDPLCGELRAAVARLHGCRLENVFAGNGSDEVLALCTRAFVERDGSVGFFEPSYSLYPVLAEIGDVEQRPVPLGDNFTWAMPDGYTCSLFLMAHPNAPTGMVYPRAQVEAFCDRCPGVVVIDEAYADFADENYVAFALARENVLAVRTLSKSYALAGLRAGYAVGHRDLVAALLKIKDSYNLDGISQALACAAVADAAYMRETAQRIKATRARLTAALRAMGFEVAPSQTNFLWVRPPRLPAADLFEALRRRRILVRHFPGPRTGAHLRITVGTDGQVDALLGAVRDILEGSAER